MGVANVLHTNKWKTVEFFEIRLVNDPDTHPIYYHEHSMEFWLLKKMFWVAPNFKPWLRSTLVNVNQDFFLRMITNCLHTLQPIFKHTLRNHTSPPWVLLNIDIYSFNALFCFILTYAVFYHFSLAIDLCIEWKKSFKNISIQSTDALKLVFDLRLVGYVLFFINNISVIRAIFQTIYYLQIDARKMTLSTWHNYKFNYLNGNMSVQ